MPAAAVGRKTAELTHFPTCPNLACGTRLEAVSTPSSSNGAGTFRATLTHYRSAAPSRRSIPAPTPLLDRRDQPRRVRATFPKQTTTTGD